MRTVSNRPGYGRLARAVVIGVAACSAVASDSNLPVPDNDPRGVKLEAFFKAYGCPAPLHINEYLRAADSHALDYRLLPAISLVESTCGAFERLNNRWGWDSARKGFASFRAGLEYIARQLAQGPYYRGKTLEEKVHMYNPKPEYAVQVKKLMRKIDDTIVVPVQDAAASSQKPGSYRMSAVAAPHSDRERGEYAYIK